MAARVEPDADDVHGVGYGWQQFHCVEGDVGVVAAVGASGLGSELEQRAQGRHAHPRGEVDDPVVDDETGVGSGTGGERDQAHGRPPRSR